MALSLMIQGTMSNTGKSLVTAGLCRIFAQDGYRTAPFKSQNMALNSFVTPDGLEIGRAQAMQAEAAGVAPDVRMNPILLKPTSDTGSQVIVNGEVVGTVPAREYYTFRKTLRPAVEAAYASLAADYDVVVIEGAGSPAEINLAADDFVNMGMAKIAAAPVLLVGDIDRGGVFASLYGTVALLPPEDQARIRGLIINKFRGDADLLTPGLSMLEDLVKKPVVGVVPMLRVDIEEEDSLSARLNAAAPPPDIDVAVIRFPRISNFTDFNALDRFPGLGVRYVRAPGELGAPDLIILPGTKSTMADLLWLRQNGLEAAVLKAASGGTPVIGVCGGYQMLGRELRDPDNADGGGTLRGMGLLPCVTVFRREKTRTRVTGAALSLPGLWAPLSGRSFGGYEIHMGKTLSEAPFACLSTGGADGCVSGNILGSYVHGLFDSGDLAAALAALLRRRKGLPPVPAPALSYGAYKETQYDLLAAELRKALDMDAVYRILKAGMPG